MLQTAVPLKSKPTPQVALSNIEGKVKSLPQNEPGFSEAFRVINTYYI